MHITLVPQDGPVVMNIEKLSVQIGNPNFNPGVTTPNWKDNLTCYECGGKGHLGRECPYRYYK